MHELSFLVVDDSATTRELVRQSLKVIFGPKAVFLAEDGKDAIRVLSREKIDIIISDWNMPNLNGEELLYEIRNDPATRDLPFIMMSSNDTRDHIVTALQLGVSQYIVKPFTVNELEKKILACVNVLNSRREQRYALPEHVAHLRFAGQRFSGTLLDISRTGAALSGIKFEPGLALFRMGELELKLLDPAGLEKEVSLLSGLSGRIVRLEAHDSFNPTSLICRVALYFPPGNVAPEVERRLNSLIRWLAGRAPDTITE